MIRSSGVRVAWKVAAHEADRGRAPRIEPCHLLVGLCRFATMDRSALQGWVPEVTGTLVAEAEDLREACRRAGIDPRALRREVRRRAALPAGAATPERADGIVHRSAAARQVFARAEELAAAVDATAVGCGHLMAAVLDRSDGAIAAALEALDLRGARFVAVPDGAPATPLLDRYGRDLTALAAAGTLEPVVGRRAEMRALARALSRQRKANAMLVGDAGVGKTGVVEGLAARLVADPPPALAGVRLVELSVTALTAGTTYRGQLEERVRDVLDELARNEHVVVFIDEIHTLVRSGSGGSAMDVATMLKPALARGELRCIGATTTEEYRRWIEGDPALRRRFEVVEVGEPSRTETVGILAGVRDRLVGHHGVPITDDALAAAVDLAVRYLPDLRLPDKAIDLLDQACARVRLASLTPQHAPMPGPVGPADVAAVVAERARVEPDGLLAAPDERLGEMERVLGQRVLGQPDAVAAVASAMRTARTGLRDPARPAGVFLFAGPSGTGKTELAKALAAFLFDGEDRLIRIDMSEYKERHAVSRLIGAPPGYLGHDREGQLTAAVRARPYSVVLLDEIEKAHPEVLDLLLPVLDDGRLTDGQGKVASFRECVIVLTSNLGTVGHRAARMGFAANGDSGAGGDDGADRIRRAVRDGLRPELLGRLGDPVVFRPLGVAELRAITRRLTDELAGRLTDRGVGLEVSEEAVDHLVRAAAHPEHGARELSRLVREHLAEPVARALVDGRLTRGATARFVAGRNGVELAL